MILVGCMVALNNHNKNKNENDNNNNELYFFNTSFHVTHAVSLVDNGGTNNNKKGSSVNNDIVVLTHRPSGMFVRLD